MQRPQGRENASSTSPPGGRPRRALLVGEDSESLRPALEATSLEIVNSSSRADFVVAYGGDGSLLGADRAFPGLPKVPVRRDNQYEKCTLHENAAVFGRISRGEEHATLLPRVCAEFKGRAIRGINDIVFHNVKVTSGVRYRIWIDGTLYAGEVIGDGLVAATPFGSSAYYRSITNSVFRVGLGIAFNNSTEAVNHLVLSERSVVEVEVLRGPAVLVADNMIDPLEIRRGERFTVRYSPQKAEIWEIENLLCKTCRMRDTGLPAGFRHV